jgi:SAM-dependent methyltransferase
VSGREREEQLKAEVQSWVNPDAGLADKLLRERIRHHKIIKDLLLDKLPTHRFEILEVGGGPLPVSDLLPCKGRLVIDPCTDDYLAIAPCRDHIPASIEDDPYLTDSMDLIICTNALDHVEQPGVALRVMDSYLKHGGYMAILCAENNALTHPHPSHKINLMATDIHRLLDSTYETVWQLDWANDRYRYGWVPFEGACGQPAFALLLRKALA